MLVLSKKKQSVLSKQASSGLQNLFQQLFVKESRPCQRLSVTIVYRPDFYDAAQRVRSRCISEWDAIQSGREARFQLLCLPSSPREAQSFLMRERLGALQGKNTLNAVITFGEWERDVVSVVRRSMESSVLHFSCVNGDFGGNISELRKDDHQFFIAATPVTPEDFVAGVMSVKPALKVVDLRLDSNTESKSFNDAMRQRCDQFVAAFKAKGVRSLVRPWSLMDKSESLTGYSRDVDAVIVLEGPSIESFRVSLVKACEQEKTLLCTTELDSVFSGAALGAGVAAESFAPPLVSALFKALIKVAPSTAERTHVIRRQEGLRYNLAALDRQGVMLSDEQRAALLMRSIYARDVVDY